MAKVEAGGRGRGFHGFGVGSGWMNRRRFGRCLPEESIVTGPWEKDEAEEVGFQMDGWDSVHGTVDSGFCGAVVTVAATPLYFLRGMPDMLCASPPPPMAVSGLWGKRAKVLLCERR